VAGRMINGAAALAELVRSELMRPDQLRSDQLRSDQLRSDQLRSDQLRSDQLRSDQLSKAGADQLGVHRVLPVLPELSGLLPGRGLRRGSTVAVATGSVATGSVAAGSVAAGSVAAGSVAAGSVAAGWVATGAVATGAVATGLAAPGSGGTSLLLALLAAASRSGSWCAVVGVPALGVLAAAESGIVLERLALVPHPGPEWPTVVAALIDGVDVVVIAVPGPVSASIASRLVARARQRGSVLMPFGRWAGADVTLQVRHGRWEGLGAGRGRLRRREVTITARGRGAAARPREITMWMPGVSTSPSGWGSHEHMPAIGTAHAPKAGTA